MQVAIACRAGCAKLKRPRVNDMRDKLFMKQTFATDALIKVAENELSTRFSLTLTSEIGPICIISNNLTREICHFQSELILDNLITIFFVNIIYFYQLSYFKLGYNRETPEETVVICKKFTASYIYIYNIANY